jgi:hypothetical protein
MNLLSKLFSKTSSILGLKGNTPLQFGVDPVPPDTLHYHYSTDGTPNIKWRTISGVGPKPRPSRLDINDSKSKFTPSKKYTGK